MSQRSGRPGVPLGDLAAARARRAGALETAGLPPSPADAWPPEVAAQVVLTADEARALQGLPSTPEAQARAVQMAALYSRVVVDPDTGCWLVGPRRSRWYVRVKVDGALVRAHRLAAELAYGPIPSGRVVRHHCDTPSCCNAQHLAVGTHAENARDAIERGRLAVGERNPGAKLTVRDVVEIRRLYRRGGGLSQRALGERFGVGQSVVSRVVSGHAWASVPRVRSAEPEQLVLFPEAGAERR